MTSLRRTEASAIDPDLELKLYHALAIVVVLVGAATWITGQFLPALTWDGFARGTSSVLDAGGGSDPLANGDVLLVFSRGAIIFGVVALVARAKGRIWAGLLSALAATAVAAAWAAAVPGNVASVHRDPWFTLDYGVIAVHPWIWVPAFGHAVVLFGLFLWALVPAARQEYSGGEDDLRQPQLSSATAERPAELTRLPDRTEVRGVSSLVNDPSMPASFPAQPRTVRPVQATNEEAATTSTTLRLAGVWLAVLAVLGIVVLLLVAWLFSSWPSDEDYPLRMGLLLAMSGGCGLIGVVAWRAGAPNRPRASIITFAIGALALVVILVPAVVVLLPPNGLYGLDLYAVGSAARLPWSVVIVVPALLMVAGTVNRWRATGDPAASRRRMRIVAASALVILVPILGLAAVDAAHPACGSGRVCVATAGISFDLPDRWSRTAPESNELYAAVAGNDQTRLVIEDGARAIREAGGTVPTDIAGVATLVPPLVEGGGSLFGRTTDVATERVALPVGVAVRVSYTSATSFFFTYYQTTISHWFFDDGRLVVIEYMRAFGESTPTTPSSDPPDLTELLGSLATL